VIDRLEASGVSVQRQAEATAAKEGEAATSLGELRARIGGETGVLRGPLGHEYPIDLRPWHAAPGETRVSVVFRSGPDPSLPAEERRRLFGDATEGSLICRMPANAETALTFDELLAVRVAGFRAEHDPAGRLARGPTENKTALEQGAEFAHAITRDRLAETLSQLVAGGRVVEIPGPVARYWSPERARFSRPPK
jgi:hypothetical protein